MEGIFKESIRDLIVEAVRDKHKTSTGNFSIKLQRYTSTTTRWLVQK
jgi:hypothetical protein